MLVTCQNGFHLEVSGVHIKIWNYHPGRHHEKVESMMEIDGPILYYRNIHGETSTKSPGNPSWNIRNFIGQNPQWFLRGVFCWHPRVTAVDGSHYHFFVCLGVAVDTLAEKKPSKHVRFLVVTGVFGDTPKFQTNHPIPYHPCFWNRDVWDEFLEILNLGHSGAGITFQSRGDQTAGTVRDDICPDLFKFHGEKFPSTL